MSASTTSMLDSTPHTWALHDVVISKWRTMAVKGVPLSVVFEPASNAIAVLHGEHLVRYNDKAGFREEGGKLVLRCADVQAIVYSDGTARSYARVKFRDIDIYFVFQAGQSALELTQALSTADAGNAIVVLRGSPVNVATMIKRLGDDHDAYIASMTASRPRNQVNLLETLWETGVASDWKVVCPTKAFPVHKAIVSAASVFFEKACSGDFLESLKSEILLPEDAPVVECILQHLYGVEQGLFGSAFLNFHAANEEAKLKTISNIVQVASAADKYLLSSLAKQAIDALAIRVTMIAGPYDMVVVADHVFDETMEAEVDIRRIPVEHLAKNIGTISEHAGAYALLAANEPLLRDVFKSVAARQSYKTASEPISPPESPSRKRARY